MEMNEREGMLHEFRTEMEKTKRILDRIPAEKLGWKPHERSISLGQLALHIATLPGGITKITQPDTFDVARNSFVTPSPSSVEEIHAALEQSIQEVEQTLTETSDARAEAGWRL